MSQSWRWAKVLKSGKGDLGTVRWPRGRVAQTVKRYPNIARETLHYPELEISWIGKERGFQAGTALPPILVDHPRETRNPIDVGARMEYVAERGFDVLYLPPVPPIGQSFRKGKNNTAKPRRETRAAPGPSVRRKGAIPRSTPPLAPSKTSRTWSSGHLIENGSSPRIAFQCSPDHPWVTEHPEFFRKRPDGSIQYAENPPKKYQDIYPLDFESYDWQGLWDALKGVFTFWIDQGVRIFRVDNPHTKAFPFWQWVIPELKAKDPGVLFLAEAFTRPRVMERLAKLGFSESYTYFTWRATKEELTEYMLELTIPRKRILPP